MQRNVLILFYHSFYNLDNSLQHISLAMEQLGWDIQPKSVLRGLDISPSSIVLFSFAQIINLE